MSCPVDALWTDSLGVRIRTRVFGTKQEKALNAAFCSQTVTGRNADLGFCTD